MKFINVEFIV